MKDFNLSQFIFIMNSSQLLSRRQPGIYMILCTVNDYRYIGETSNVALRLAGHRRDLRRKIHSNENLQKDFNLYGEPLFEFTILYIGDDWGNREDRIKTEGQLIMNNMEKCYNTYAFMSERVGQLNGFYGKKHSQVTKTLISQQKKGIPNDLLGRKVSISGVEYPSIAEASRKLGHSRKLIRTRVNDPQCLDWYTIGNA